jgi:hypothetical protein
LDWVRNSGGQCWNIVRPSGFYEYEGSALKTHQSEQDLKDAKYDVVVMNDGTLEDLRVNVLRLLEEQ